MAKAADTRKETAFRYYVGDVLAYIAENTARFVGEGGRYTARTFSEIMEPKTEELIADAEQTAKDRLSRMGIEVV